MKRNPTALIGALLLLIFVLLLFVFQVRRSEVAVVTTFGEATRTNGPGAHLKWPWPIQQVHTFDQRIHNLESKFEQVMTADQYNLLLMAYVGWTISEPKQFFRNFGDSVSKAEEALEGMLRNTYSGVVGRHPFSNLISTDTNELKFTEIEKEMLTKIQADLLANTNNYGIQVEFLGIKKLGLPESVTEAVFERMRSDRQVATSKIQSEGEAQASNIRGAADLASAKVLTEADRQAKQIISTGEREAARTFGVFQQEPELANFLLRLGALESLLKEKTVLVLDTQTEPLNLLKGPNAGSTNAPANPRGKPSVTSDKAGGVER